MVRLSVLIGAVTGVAMLVVASVTLSVALSYSLAALRAVGRTHAGSMMSTASSKVQDYIDASNNANLATVNYFAGGQRPFPSEDASGRDANALADVLLATFRASGSRTWQTTFFGVDGTSCPTAPHPYCPGEILQELNSPLGGGPVKPLTRSWSGLNGSFSRDPLCFTNYFPFDARALYLPGNAGAAIVGVIDSFGPSPPALSVPPQFAAFVIRSFVPYWQLPLVRKIYNGSGTFMGISYTTTELGLLDGFLASSRTSSGSQLFVVDASGFVLSSTAPGGALNNTIVPAGTIPPEGCGTTEFTSTPLFGGAVWQSCRVRMTQFPWAPARSVMNVLPASGSSAYVTLAEEGFFIARRDVSIANSVGFTMTLIALLPEIDVIGDVTEGRDIAIGVTAAVFILATALSVSVVFVLLRPLNDVAEHMELASNLEEVPTVALSSVTEVGNLQSAFQSLNRQLKRITAFVPASVLARKYQDVDEEICENESRRESAPRSERASAEAGSATRTATGSRSQRAVGFGSTLNVNTGMTERAVSVAIANTRGFNEFANGLGTSGFAAHYDTFMSAVTAQIEAHQGVLDEFHGDQIVASFNGARPISQHARRAALTALKLCSVLGEALNLAVNVGIATGRALVGNAGCNHTRRFVIIGGVMSKATVLSRFAAQAAVNVPGKHGGGAYCSYTTVTDLVQFKLIPVGLGRTDGVNQGKPFAAFQLLSAPVEDGDAAAVEWLYIVGGQEAEGELIEAYGALDRGDVSRSRGIVESIKAKRNGSDPEHAALAAIGAALASMNVF